MAKYEVTFNVTCKVNLEVKADCIEDAMDIADEMMEEIDIGEYAEDFEWEAKSAVQLLPLLGVVYGVDEYGDPIFKESDDDDE